MRVLVFGTYDARVHPRVAVLIDGLRAHGVEVRELNAPLEVSTAERVASVRQPWRAIGPAGRLVARWSRLIGGARRHRGVDRPDVVLVGFLGHFDVLLARRLFRDSTIVLDHLVSAEETARDRGVRGRGVLGALRWLDRRAVGAADRILVDTVEHRRLVPQGRADDVAVVSVGASQPWFDAGARRPPPDPARPLRVVFYGLYTPLHGAPVIGSAIAMLNDESIRVTMVGHGQDLASTQSAAAGARNVTWMEWVDPSELPELVASHDVCLGIFGTTDKSMLVVPNKVFQGLAAGCAVVTSDTAPQQRLLGSNALLVAPGDPGALAEALRTLAADRALAARLGADGAQLARTTMTASAVVEPLVASLETSRRTP